MANPGSTALPCRVLPPDARRHRVGARPGGCRDRCRRARFARRAATASAQGQRVPRDREPDPVVGNALLDDIADIGPHQMVAANELEHDMATSAIGSTRSGVCWCGFGEIIAWERGYPDYSYGAHVELWWDSPGHHGIMMGEDYNAAGGAWDTACRRRPLLGDGLRHAVRQLGRRRARHAAQGRRGTTPTARGLPTAAPIPGYRLSVRWRGARAKDRHLHATGARRRSAGHARVDGRPLAEGHRGPLAGYWVRETANSYRARRDRSAPGSHPTKQLALEGGPATSA